ncbi:SEED MATURATION PROTEIN 1 [Macadamia integrifolia]|uniref:SEED MATURATION PROTEIN 1 n=1 Tax=Macadamia integrifolia TaxID=60698 RepID=UPI001C4F0C07|nr:SEED MATURATION PROTEIN 1 [Macadamia integrifolia]
MAESKEDVKYGTAQAKLSPEETLRVAYKSGTPLEGGMISRSEPVDLFSGAHNISEANSGESGRDSSTKQQLHHTGGGDEKDSERGRAPTTAPAG